MRKNISIGSGRKIDKNVILGHWSGRKIKNAALTIGKNPTIRSGTIIYQGSKIGDGFETGHNVVVREENTLGDNVFIWSNSVIDYGCSIGNNVKVHTGVYIAQFTEIEDDVFIAPGVVMANDPCPVCTKCMKGPTIRKGAKIGVNSTILPGVTIGECSLVGAGSVVTKHVPPFSLVYGNPAKVIKKVTDIKCKKGIVKKPYGDR